MSAIETDNYSSESFNNVATFQTRRDDQGKQPNKTTRRLGNNTTGTIREDNTIAIRLYDTDVFTIDMNDYITLNTGGHKTATTKQRMNQYLDNHTVFQKRGEWFVWDMQADKIHEFFDGIAFNIA